MKGKNRPIVMIGLAFLAIAVIAFVIGGWIAGWDFKGWFTSNTAYAIYIVVGIYVLIVLYFLTKDLIGRL